MRGAGLVRGREQELLQHVPAGPGHAAGVKIDFERGQGASDRVVGGESAQSLV